MQTVLGGLWGPQGLEAVAQLVGEVSRPRHVHTGL